MSWASIYWDLDHIVQAAREAMELAYAEETAARLPTVPVPAEVSSSPKSVLTPDITADPLKIVEAELFEKPSASAETVPEITISTPTGMCDRLDPSLNQSLIKAKVLDNQAGIRPVSPWTAEIEAALREFLRPLSVNLRYEYRFPDSMNEKRSIDAMNSLFQHRFKAEDAEPRPLPTRTEVRRKNVGASGDQSRSLPREAIRPTSKTDN